MDGDRAETGPFSGLWKPDRIQGRNSPVQFPRYVFLSPLYINSLRRNETRLNALLCSENMKGEKGDMRSKKYIGVSRGSTRLNFSIEFLYKIGL